MEIKNVIGDNAPEKFESLQGGTLLNAGIEELQIDGVVKFKYKQTFVTETNEEILEKKYIKLVCEVYKEYLNKTDHKFFNGYKSRDREDLVAIEAKRDEAREYIRMNEVA